MNYSSTKIRIKSIRKHWRILSLLLLSIFVPGLGFVPLSTSPKHSNRIHVFNEIGIHYRYYASSIPDRNLMIFSSTNPETDDEDTFDDTSSYPLEQLLHPSSKCDVDQISPTTLAYIGDSVFELFVRSRYIWPSRRTTDLQHKVVGTVRGE